MPKDPKKSQRPQTIYHPGHENIGNNSIFKNIFKIFHFSVTILAMTSTIVIRLQAIKRSNLYPNNKKKAV